MFKIFKKKEAPRTNTIDDLLLGEEEITAIKPTKEAQPQQFLEGFDMSKHGRVDEKILEKVKNPTKVEVPKNFIFPEDKPKIKKIDNVKEALPSIGKGMSNEQKKELLKNSLIIMIDNPIDSDELDFIGNSRENGRPVYRYIGKDFLFFRDKYKNRQFDEVVYNPGYGIF